MGKPFLESENHPWGQPRGPPQQSPTLTFHQTLQPPRSHFPINNPHPIDPIKYSRWDDNKFTTTYLWSDWSFHASPILSTFIIQLAITLSWHIRFTQFIMIGQRTEYTLPLVATHTSQTTFRHLKIERKSWRRTPTPHCNFSSLVYIQLSLRQLDMTENFSKNPCKIRKKGYIELPTHSFYNFFSLVMSFLIHFQLPIQYEMGTEVLTSLWQSISTDILDHIHEWRQCQRLIKATIHDQLLAYWFTKSLFPPIIHDVAMGGVVTEEQAINHAQYLYFV